MPVTLINVFTVHKGKEEEFVKWWEDIRADITKRPGFISGKFYRSLKPDSRFISLTSPFGKMKSCIGRRLNAASRTRS